MNICLTCQQPTRRAGYCGDACREAEHRHRGLHLLAPAVAPGHRFACERRPPPFLVQAADSLPHILDQLRDHWAVLTQTLPPEMRQRLTVLREDFDAYARALPVALHAAGYARLPRALRAWVVEATRDAIGHPLTSGYRFEFYDTLLAWAEGGYLGADPVPHAAFLGDLPVALRLSADDKRRLTQNLKGMQVLFRLPADLELPLGKRWRGLEGAMCIGECVRFLGSDTGRAESFLDARDTRWDHDLRQPMRIWIPSNTQPDTSSLEYGTWQIPVSWIEEVSEWHDRYWGPVDWSDAAAARTALTTPLPASRFADRIAAGERV